MGYRKLLSYVECYKKDPMHWARINLASCLGAFFYDFTGILICTQFFSTCVCFRLPAHVPAKCTKCLCVFPPKKMPICISLENCLYVMIEMEWPMAPYHGVLCDELAHVMMSICSGALSYYAANLKTFCKWVSYRKADGCTARSAK